MSETGNFLHLILELAEVDPETKLRTKYAMTHSTHLTHFGNL